MRFTTRCLACGFVLLAACCAVAAASDWRVDVESGVAIMARNNIRIPNSVGTTFSLTDDLSADAAVYWRAKVEWRFAEHHTVSAMVMPLHFTASGEFDRPTRFYTRLFQPDSTIRATYEIDLYYLTYRYTLVDREQVRLSLGLTGRYRDSEVRLDDGFEAAKATRQQFRPLANFHVDWMPSSIWTFRLAGDAMVWSEGRVADIAAVALYRVQRNLQVKAGYRVIEGEQDDEKVFNTALVHSIVLGLILTT